MNLNEAKSESRKTVRKKKYEKPAIIHKSKIETLAGSCILTTLCTPTIT